MIFDEDVDLDALKTILKDVAVEKFGQNLPKKLKLPVLKDGNEFKEKDEEGNETDQIKDGYENKIVLAVNTDTQPQVVDSEQQPIICDKKYSEDFYAGCYAIATLKVYAYDYEGINKGVSIKLNNLQKIADYEPLGGGVIRKIPASEEFQPLNFGNVEEESKVAQEKSNESNDPFATM